ncbi:MAG TPA: nuclear transport factor 2 family protein [Thermoanaerobaculia bacterium]|nr:nuclear transport factor 2 family protein [Thermoanaerobaculia bacterium]
MKIRFSAILVLAALLSGSAALAQEGAQTIDAAWMKAMKAGDVNGIMACYASDAVLWFPGDAEARGEKAIRDLYAGVLSTNTVTDVALTNAHYETSQNLSTGWGNFVMTLQPKAGGKAATMHGRFIDVAKKIGGKWKYVADHASADPPPAEKPAATK